MNIDAFNRLTQADAKAWLQRCCVSQRWIQGMLADRPYANLKHVLENADRVWQVLEDSDFLEAFQGHPKIGDVTSLRAKYADTATLAAGEQSLVGDAKSDVIQRLAIGNTAYEARFGFIFIVFASGKTAQQMLALLEERLENSREVELAIAAKEQHKITRLRLETLP